MRNGKYSKRRGVTSKTLVLALVLMLVVGATIGGTLAWLTDTSDQVVNTFTDSDIDITLSETTGTSYKMVPGYTITKDPKVTVETGSEECWLFVKLEKANDFDKFLTYEIDTTVWTKLEGVTEEVYYCHITTDKMGEANAISVLKGDKVSVLGSVTKADMNGLTEATYPKLTVTAYASQYYETQGKPFDVAKAWENISGT